VRAARPIRRAGYVAARPARRIRLDEKCVARYRNGGRLDGEGIALIQSFDHTSFTVADIERAVVFWRDVMGFAVADLSTREGDWLGAVVGVPGARCRIAHPHGHGAHLEFIQYVEIGDDVFVGPGVIIMPSVRIGNGAVVAAGSVVIRSVPDLTMVRGNPAEPIARCSVPLGLLHRSKSSYRASSLAVHV
jgi:acetyltransferase-like isoleucine patch superfamily enzyme